MKEDDERDRKEFQELIDKLQKYAPNELVNDIPIEEYYQLKLGFVKSFSLFLLLILIFFFLVLREFEFLKFFFNLLLLVRIKWVLVSAFKMFYKLFHRMYKAN